METYDPHKTTTEVRQGSRRLLNFRVLIVSLVVIVAAFGLLWLWSAMSTPPTAV